MKTYLATLVVLAVASAAPEFLKSELQNLHKKPIKHVASKPNPHIIGGNEATPHSLPYQAFIEIELLDRSTLYCGGALISPNYVLTSAHCLQNIEMATVHLGTHNYQEQGSSELSLISRYFTRHPQYQSSGILYDLALIRLPQTVHVNDYIQTIVLASNPDNNFAGSVATVSGWGITNRNDSNISDVLNYLTAAVITNKDCESYFGPLDPTFLCIAPEPNSGICDGDAGDPLVTEGVLIGMAAFTAANCIGYPAGFTRIASFIDWIKDATDL